MTGSESSNGTWKTSDNRRDGKYNPSKTAALGCSLETQPGALSLFLITSRENTSDKLFKHILLWCRIPPPLLRERFPFLQLACRWPWGGIDRPRAREPHIAHTSVSTGLLLTNSLFSTSRARSMLRRGGHIVRHYQDNGAIWGTEGSPARLFSSQQTV